MFTGGVTRNWKRNSLLNCSERSAGSNPVSLSKMKSKWFNEKKNLQ